MFRARALARGWMIAGAALDGESWWQFMEQQHRAIDDPRLFFAAIAKMRRWQGAEWSDRSTDHEYQISSVRATQDAIRREAERRRRVA